MWCMFCMPMELGGRRKKMSRLDAVWSSKSDEWSTPKELFDELNKEFGFTLDPCSTDDNHLCDKYYTVQDNGLDQAWGGESVLQSAI